MHTNLGFAIRNASNSRYGEFMARKGFCATNHPLNCQRAKYNGKNIFIFNLPDVLRSLKCCSEQLDFVLLAYDVYVCT